MKERLFTLLAVLALLITGLQPVLPSGHLAGAITPFGECQDSTLCVE